MSSELTLLKKIKYNSLHFRLFVQHLIECPTSRNKYS